MQDDSPQDSGWTTTVTRLHDAIFGWNGQDGIISKVERHSRRLDSLEQWRRDIETIKEWLRWLTLTAGALIAFGLSDPVSRAVGAALRAYFSAPH